MKIKYVDHGVANRFDDCIEVNKNLLNYPDLHRDIMNHELGHDSGPFTMKDFKHDLDCSNQVNQLDLLKFMIKHPRSFTQLLPFYWQKDRGFVRDKMGLMFYGYLLGIIILSFVIGLTII